MSGVNNFSQTLLTLDVWNIQLKVRDTDELIQFEFNLVACENICNYVIIIGDGNTVCVIVMALFKKEIKG